MNKSILVSTLKKYHLNGEVDAVKWVINDKKLNIRFLSNNKNLVGYLEASDFDLNDCELGIYNTTQFAKLVKITDDFITLDVVVGNYGVATELNISDNSYDLKYYLSDLQMIEEPDVVNEPESYDCTIHITQDLIEKFLKAKKALGDIKQFTVNTDVDEDGTKVIFTVGDGNNYSNKIKFKEVAESMFGIDLMPFQVDLFAAILEANDHFTTGKIEIYNEGLMKITFEEDSIKTTYFLVRLQ